MKKVFLFMLCLMVVLTTLPVMPVSAANAMTVDCANVLRGVTHCASGSLYGISVTKPADLNGLVAPLKPAIFRNPGRSGVGNQHNNNAAAIPVAQRVAGIGAVVSVDLPDMLPGWPYVWPGMTSWLSQVNSFITDKKASGVSNIYAYEIWNEPDGTWKSANGSFNDMWRQTYNVIRANDPSAKISGPDWSWYDNSAISSFLSYCKTNNCLPDIMSWHELRGIQNVSNNLKAYRTLETSLGISQRPIYISEYCDADHALEGQPGSAAQFIGKFERYKVDKAAISWWFTAYQRLGSILATDTQKGAGWFFYKWYGDMTGNMVSVTPPNDAADLVDGAACVDSGAKYISFIFGGNNDGTINTTFKNIPSFIGSTASVKIEKVDWVSKDTVCNGTTTISTSNYTVSNGQITVNLTGCNSNSGYRIYITSTGSSTPTPTPTPSTATATPTPTPVPGTATPSPTPVPGTATPSPTPSAGTPAPGGISVQFFNGNTAAATNTIYPNFKVVNTGTSAINLSDVKIRYYFTNDGTQADSFACDYSTAGSGNVIGSFTTITGTNADRYLEVGFTSAAGTLAAGASAEVKGRVWKSDWSNFTQTNDYSFNSTATNYVDSTTVTGYLAGALKWGTQP